MLAITRRILGSHRFPKFITPKPSVPADDPGNVKPGVKPKPDVAKEQKPLKVK